MIVTCAFREPYLTHNLNQLKRINNTSVLTFRDCLPYSEGIIRDNIIDRFQKSLYGFKPNAIQKAIDLGEKYVIWFDPSVLPIDDVSVIYDQLKDSDMLIIKGNNHIKEMTNEKSFKYFGVNPDVNHIGGTIYAFNFNSEKTKNAFNIWKQAEQDGIFGNQDEFMAGHWADESCMVLSMFKAGIEQKQLNFNYKNQKEL